MSARDHEWQYNPRVTTPDSARYRERAEAESAATRERLAFAGDIAYGERPESTLDLFPGTPGGPAHLFLHGGYWRGRDKRDFSFVAAPLVEIGTTVLVANYQLCPAATLREIIAQTADLLAALPGLAERHGFDASRVIASGHSAGAHLLAAAMSAPEHRARTAGSVRSLVLVSGIFDLTPVPAISVNEEIRLDPGDVTALSPMAMDPPEGVAMDIVVGGAESPGWIAQSALYAEKCQLAGVDADFLVAPCENHSSIMETYADAASPLFARLSALPGFA
ncbi:alpha/beta hydrolase [Acuticoccus sediminis]|uniref:alpha/beta hydrolase n=1 Tax=Acuticoccus sediminis TaxID=2184697 RepID=UPI001CFDFCB1|nr:alpha/beta hydrolase [Acuticoccus sediminis]